MVQSRNIHNKIALSNLTKISRTQIKVKNWFTVLWSLGKIEQGWQDHYHIIQDVFVRHYFIGLIKKGCTSIIFWWHHKPRANCTKCKLKCINMHEVYIFVLMYCFLWVLFSLISVINDNKFNWNGKTF